MTRHSIVHVEIPAKNREQSARFYSDLFGWKYEHMAGPVPYTSFETGNIGGGFPDIDGKMFEAGDVLVYVDSDDIDGDLQRAQTLGASVLVGKTEVPGYGHFAIFKDPSGNRMALWKASQPRQS
jgi:predicted enzyme related to lactoylglutathione lyase